MSFTPTASPGTRWLATAIRSIPLIGLAVLAAAGAPAQAASFDSQPFTVKDQSWMLRVPAGYRLEYLAPMDAPRLMSFVGDDVLLVGSRAKVVYRLEPPYRHATVYAQLGGSPHDIARRGEVLFVARNEGVYQTAYREQPMPPLGDDDFTLLARLPSGAGHSSRSIGFGPDGRLYMSLGISGNCSDQYLDDSYPFETRRGGVAVLVQSGGGASGEDAQAAWRWQPYASGLRNPVGFDWHPDTGVLYASNHGPDHHGYEQPPEYFSRLAPGSFHGMPWFQFDGRELVRDRCIGTPSPRTDAVAPVATFPARNGPMDMVFAPAGSPWSGDAIVALHGSWATQPQGGFFGSKSSRRPPWIAIVKFAGASASGDVDILIAGFQDDAGLRLARPAGVAFGPDGHFYFTSDGGVLQGLFRLRKI